MQGFTVRSYRCQVAAAKKISSILEKCQRKNVPLEELEEKIEDIAGIRIICQFVEDIERVVEIIRKRSDMIIKKEKDYIVNSKESGYRSYHVIVYYTVQTINGPKNLEVEIQIRTLAMNFWAIIEHSLQYKYKENMPDEVRGRLLRAAKAVGMHWIWKCPLSGMRSWMPRIPTGEKRALSAIS